MKLKGNTRRNPQKTTTKNPPQNPQTNNKTNYVLYYYTLHYSVLYITVLYTPLHYSVLYFDVLYNTIYDILSCNIIRTYHTIPLCYTLLHNTLLYCTVLYCTISYHITPYILHLCQIILYYMLYPGTAEWGGGGRGRYAFFKNRHCEKILNWACIYYQLPWCI